MTRALRIGCGAGFSGDRVDPARVLVDRGELDVLVFECLAERTIALAQLRRQHDPTAGFDPLLVRRLEPILAQVVTRGIRVVTNMGAANPLAGAEEIKRLARRLGLRLRVAAVTGDDLFGILDRRTPAMESGRPIADYGRLVSANAYLGIDALLPALETGADVVITGRVADPSLFLAPLVAHFGWRPLDLDLLARGGTVGHLMECAGQLCGGYYADPGTKDVPDLANLGFPFVDVTRDGVATFGKVEGTGGVINRGTVTEQLLYEVSDPSSYITPDVVIDFTPVEVHETAPDRVTVRGAAGRPAPSSLKVSVGYHAGWIGEAEISYAGTNCVRRAALAGEVVRRRLEAELTDLRVDLIGADALHGDRLGTRTSPYEVRLRVAGRAASQAVAMRVGEEVEALYTNGPAGGGGVRKAAYEQIGIVSCLVDRGLAAPRVTVLE